MDYVESLLPVGYTFKGHYRACYDLYDCFELDGALDIYWELEQEIADDKQSTWLNSILAVDML